ncbi:MAG TPA: LssY C-terminal domain-containing protein [Edaphobacter sp.]
MIRATVLLLTLGVGAVAGGQTGATAAVPTTPVTTVRVGSRVEAVVSMRDKPVVGAAAVPVHKQNYEFTLKDGEWLDTGVVLGAGETASFTATGSFTLSDGREVGPDGLARGWKDLLRQFPLNQAQVGALIGRVSDMGASVPFSIGANGNVAMPTSGTLYLRANVSSDLTASGSVAVKVTFAPAVKAVAAASSATATPVSSLVSAEMFADVPRRVTDQAAPGGNEGDMVNFGLVGTQEQVVAAFKAAGWVTVDKSVQDAIVSGLMATLNKEAYTAMPMSTLYLFGRPQDMSYARADPLMVAAERHHLRVWRTDKTIGGRAVWVGSSTRDIGFEKDQRNGKVTHKIDPEIDKERDYLLQSFDAAGVFSSAAYVTPDNPMIEARTATGGSFHSDGRIVVMDLK